MSWTQGISCACTHLDMGLSKRLINGSWVAGKLDAGHNSTHYIRAGPDTGLLKHYRYAVYSSTVVHNSLLRKRCGEHCKKKKILSRSKEHTKAKTDLTLLEEASPTV